MLLIQAGHQSSTQIADALPADRANGVIWSPGDETPESLGARMHEAEGDGIIQALDPQLYVALLEDANPKRLCDHELFEIPMTRRHFSARRLSATVERIIDYQLDLPSTHIIAPTVAVSSMIDRSAQIALNLAETALDLWEDRDDDRPLFISAAIERSVLADRDNVNAFLDELTAHEAEGYYLLFEVDPRLDATHQDDLLAEALYIVYTLAVTQGIEVWVGYAGLTGYLYRAVGAGAFAAGWFQKQQWWSVGHWAPSGGRRAPRSRIYLESLLGSLLTDPELVGVRSQRHDRELGADLLNGVGDLAAAYRDGRSPATDRGSCAAQLFDVCSALDDRISGDVVADLRRVRQDLLGAAALYQRLSEAGVELEGRSAGNHIGVWQGAISTFSDRADLPL